MQLPFLYLNVQEVQQHSRGGGGRRGAEAAEDAGGG